MVLMFSMLFYEETLLNYIILHYLNVIYIYSGFWLSILFAIP